MKQTLSSILLILITFSIVFPQNSKRTNIWYFGRNAGLDFNNDPPTPLFDGALNIWEGCATICETNGQILIYSDGIKIWNKNHVIIPGATNLGGDNSATQSGIIVPKPNDSNLLYVFSVDNNGGSGGLRYAIVDMRLNDGLGGLISSNNVLMNNSTEKITAVSHYNSRDFWIIGHELYNNNFVTWQLTSDGISLSPIVTSVGTPHGSPYLGSAGYLKSSPNSSKLALGVYGGRFFEVFDFNNQTGEISNPIILQNSQFSKPYGVEFSPNGELLYVAGTETSPILFQINLALSTPQEIQNSVTIVGQGTSSYFGAIQLAPDGKIYIAKDNSRYLSIISSPDELGTSCDFVEDGLYLGGKKSGLGLPNLVPSFFQEEEFEINLVESLNLCNGTANIEVSISPLSDNIFYQWYYEGSIIANQTSSSIQVDTSGEYTIEVSIFLHDQSQPLQYSQQIIIEIPQLVEIQEVNINNTTCSENNGSIQAIVNSSAWVQYSIDGVNFQNENLFENLSPGSYTITVQDDNGCINNQNVVVEPSEIPVIENIEVIPASCEGNNGSLTVIADGGTGILQYSINGNGYQSSPQFFNLFSDSYTVLVKDESNCIISEDIEIGGTPQMEIVNITIEHTDCGEKTGSILFEIAGGTGQIFSSINGGDTQTTNLFQNLPAGEYEIITMDEAACEAKSNVQVLISQCPIYIPNAFSPNNDGVNDLFQIYTKSGFDVTINKYLIFDRWGEHLYETGYFSINSSNKWWDGTFKGKKLGVGIYVYYIEVEFENGEKEIYEGDVKIVK